jgi:hypothetical protein
MHVKINNSIYIKNRFFIRSFKNISSSHVTVQIQQSRALFLQGPFGAASKMGTGI